jgi:hypothetical protein
MTPDRIRSPDDFTPQPEDLEKLEQIPKRCPGCGSTWSGWMWKDRLPKAGPTPQFDEDGTHVTHCYECLDRLEAEAQQRTQAQQAPPDLELERPQTTEEEDDHGW